jgi:putative hemolysin
MSPLLLILGVAVGLVFSGIFSGSETGLYSVSKPRVNLEADEGLRGARYVRKFANSRAALLVTILIGNNLALELMTLSAEDLLHQRGFSPLQRDLVLSFVLTPTVFLLGELLPKDLFRRRPHVLLRWTAPILAVCRVAFWPLGVLLLLLSRALELAFGLEPAELAEHPRRHEVLSVLAEGRAAGALEPHAEELAHNALKLRSLPVTRAMIPWKQVLTLDADAGEEALAAAVEGSSYTRLPLVRGREVLGYVHQLSALEARGSKGILECVEGLLFVDPGLSVDRALSRLRHAGRRMAVVGTPDAPQGLVTLKDLLEEISGDLGGW